MSSKQYEGGGITEDMEIVVGGDENIAGGDENIEEGDASDIHDEQSDEEEEAYTPFQPDPGPLEPPDISSGEFSLLPKVIILPLYSEVQNGESPINYTMSLTIACPDPTDETEYTVEVDTGSSLLWVKSQLDEEDDPTLESNKGKVRVDGPLFTPIPLDKKSPEYKAARESEIIIDDDQKRYELNYSQNKVKFQPFGVLVYLGYYSALQTVGAVQISQMSDKIRDAKAHVDGMIGLGFHDKDLEWNTHLNIVEDLQAQGAIDDAVFTLIGPRLQDAGKMSEYHGDFRYRGSIAFGRVYKQYFSNDPTWCPLIKQPAGENRKWQVMLEEVRVNGILIAENQKALIDSGTAYIIAHKEKTDKILKILTAEYDANRLLFPNTTIVKNITFKFGQKEFPLNVEDIAIGKSRSSDGRLYSGIMKGGSNWRNDEWVLGGIFIDNMTTIFDIGRERIGFADVSLEEMEKLAQMV